MKHIVFRFKDTVIPNRQNELRRQIASWASISGSVMPGASYEHSPHYRLCSAHVSDGYTVDEVCGKLLELSEIDFAEDPVTAQWMMLGRKD